MNRPNGYMVEMIELVDGQPVPFAPRFGSFASMIAAKQMVALRIELSAPRNRPVGYRILDQENRQVRIWMPG